VTGRPVVLERRGAVARIVLDRPDRRNALGRDTLPALHAVLDEVERDTAIGAVIVTGRGPVFCAGGDVDETQSFAFRTQEHKRRLGAFRAARRRPKP